MPLDPELEEILKKQGVKMFLLTEENEKLKQTISFLSGRVGRLESAFKSANKKKRYWREQVANEA